MRRFKGRSEANRGQIKISFHNAQVTMFSCFGPVWTLALSAVEASSRAIRGGVRVANMICGKSQKQLIKKNLRNRF